MRDRWPRYKGGLFFFAMDTDMVGAFVVHAADDPAKLFCPRSFFCSSLPRHKGACNAKRHHRLAEYRGVPIATASGLSSVRAVIAP